MHTDDFGVLGVEQLRAKTTVHVRLICAAQPVIQRLMKDNVYTFNDSPSWQKGQMVILEHHVTGTLTMHTKETKVMSQRSRDAISVYSIHLMG